MKKLLLVLFGLAILGSCTPPENANNEANGIDPTKACQPNDRNCDGCPDDQEPCD